MRHLRLLFILIFILSLATGAVQAQTSTPSAEVQRILDSMTPEEKVGQLFIVSFNGTNTGSDSEISNLITRYHVGSVALSTNNDNFTDADTVSNAHSLIASLQELEWGASQDTLPLLRPEYIPLFMGITHGGDGYTPEQIINGLTPLPSSMAVGATWNVELAQNFGNVRGHELSALGFNLFLGPSLDVLESPSSTGGDLGTQVFGGDPFWVGEMGRAYVSGLHDGSKGKLLVIAGHFPGVGGADRLPEDEVSTVRKSLEQLKQIELAPFFAVTGNSLNSQSTVDGLLVSHIRYQGFQGNIRATTRPISFDPQALDQIMALQQFSRWYVDGKMLVSDDLGTTAVSEFYTSGGGQFLARIAARDAFLAGNDLLHLGNIKSDDAPDTYTTVTRIIDFFVQKYQEDSAFAVLVDEAVARILTAKLNLYGTFSLDKVLTSEAQLARVGTESDGTFTVARNAATLVNPSGQDLTTILPLPPQPNERLVFITSSISTKQCSECTVRSLPGTNALEAAVLQLYGPQSGNQVEPFRMTSYSFENLQALLDTPDDSKFMIEGVDAADWVVISLGNVSQGQPALLSRFLRERPDLLRDKNVILFSFGAPYYFDTTTISKFTAYYSLYSAQPQFIDVAARLLFQELNPIGASPVSIPAVGYDLISVTAPDPNQVIPLILDLPADSESIDSAAPPEPTPIPLFKISDTIALRTGIIKDGNGHPVPDGTVVQFSMVVTGESGGILQQVESTTTQGMARASFGLDKPGLLEIRVSSEPAVISEVLQLDVSQSGEAAVTVVVPELTQSIEPVLPSPEVVEEEGFISSEGYPRFPAWLVAMLVIGLTAGFAYVITLQLVSSTTALRWALGVAIGGLLAYNMLSFGLFGLEDWLFDTGLTGVVGFVFAGELAGAVTGWLWSRGR